MIIKNIIDYNLDCNKYKSNIEFTLSRRDKNNTRDFKNINFNADGYSDYGMLLGSNWTLTQETNNSSTLTFTIMYTRGVDIRLNTNDQITMEYITDTDKKVMFIGSISQGVEEDDNANNPIKSINYTANSVDKAILEMPIIKTWKDKTIREIINDVWLTWVQDNVNGMNKPQIANEPEWDIKLEKFHHEDSIRALLDVLSEDNSGLWWFVGETLYLETKDHVEKKYYTSPLESDIGMRRSPIVLNQVDNKYANQVKFKCKDIKGNQKVETNLGTPDKNCKFTLPYEIYKPDAKSTSFSLNGKVYEYVTDINEKNPKPQYSVDVSKGTTILSLWPKECAEFQDDGTKIEGFKSNCLGSNNEMKGNGDEATVDSQGRDFEILSWNVGYKSTSVDTGGVSQTYNDFMTLTDVNRVEPIVYKIARLDVPGYNSTTNPKPNVNFNQYLKWRDAITTLDNSSNQSNRVWRKGTPPVKVNWSETGDFIAHTPFKLKGTPTASLLSDKGNTRTWTADLELVSDNGKWYNEVNIEAWKFETDIRNLVKWMKLRSFWYLLENQPTVFEDLVKAILWNHTNDSAMDNTTSEFIATIAGNIYALIYLAKSNNKYNILDSTLNSFLNDLNVLLFENGKSKPIASADISTWKTNYNKLCNVIGIVDTPLNNTFKQKQITDLFTANDDTGVSVVAGLVQQELDKYYANLQKERQEKNLYEFKYFVNVNEVIVLDDVKEQAELHAVKNAGWVVSQDITNTRITTYDDAVTYCRQYLKESVKVEYETKLELFRGDLYTPLTNWFWRPWAVNLHRLNQVAAQTCGVKHNHVKGKYINAYLEPHIDHLFLLHYRKISQIAPPDMIGNELKTNGLIENKKNLKFKPIPVSNLSFEYEFNDGFKNRWEDYFKRDKYKYVDDDTKEKNITENLGLSDSGISKGYDMVATNVTIDGTTIAVSDPNLTKDKLNQKFQTEVS